MSIAVINSKSPMSLQQASIALECLTDSLMLQVEYLVTEALKNNVELVSYCQAMGSASFHAEYLQQWDDGEVTEESSDMEPGELDWLECPHVKELANLIYELDSSLKLSGTPLRLVKDESGNIIKSTNW